MSQSGLRRGYHIGPVAALAFRRGHGLGSKAQQRLIRAENSQTQDTCIRSATERQHLHIDAIASRFQLILSAYQGRGDGCERNDISQTSVSNVSIAADVGFDPADLHKRSTKRPTA